jgi:hypothetical protein
MDFQCRIASDWAAMKDPLRKVIVSVLTRALIPHSSYLLRGSKQYIFQKTISLKYTLKKKKNAHAALGYHPSIKGQGLPCTASKYVNLVQVLYQAEPKRLLELAQKKNIWMAISWHISIPLCCLQSTQKKICGTVKKTVPCFTSHLSCGFVWKYGTKKSKSVHQSCLFGADPYP